MPNPDLPPPVKNPPTKDQKSWPQVDFLNDDSVAAFVETGRYGIINDDAVCPPLTYAGWTRPGQVFSPKDSPGSILIRVLSDRWTAGDGTVNPDAKMPDDDGWIWAVNTETFRVVRIKADTVVRPVLTAKFTFERGGPW